MHWKGGFLFLHSLAFLLFWVYFCSRFVYKPLCASECICASSDASVHVEVWRPRVAVSYVPMPVLMMPVREYVKSFPCIFRSLSLANECFSRVASCFVSAISRFPGAFLIAPLKNCHSRDSFNRNWVHPPHKFTEVIFREYAERWPEYLAEGECGVKSTFICRNLSQV